MKPSSSFIRLRSSLLLGALLSMGYLTHAQSKIRWEAFNDYRPTDGVTHVNATGYDLRVTGDGGFLRDIKTGADLAVSVNVIVEGDGTPDNFGANSPVNAGSPADKLFAGRVDVGNEGLPGLRANQNVKLILEFTGLDPTKRYNFRGTVSRGGNYNDRWSLFGITGAEAFVEAHEDGSVNKNLITKASFDKADLKPNQVALNSGDNKAGSLVGWDNIEPGADGAFSIEAQQYVGPAPFGNPSAAPYGYGFNAIYLAELESTGNLRITENPANQIVPAGRTALLKVAATSPQAITYQWQKAAPGTALFSDISGATQAAYTTPALTVADDGTTYRCQLASGTAKATSGDAIIQVDGSIPTVTRVAGSINFNAVYVTFSEPMKLEMLANTANYQLGGGLTLTSAVALDAANVRLLTSKQTMGANYSVTMNNIEDLAGNKVAANSTRNFAGFTVQPGVVGLEIWKNIGGGAVQNLRDNPRYPLEPDVDYVTTSFDSTLIFASGPNNTYGGRFRAWLTPEETGLYEFFIRADNAGEFRISMNDKFDNLDSPDLFADAEDGTAGDPFQEPGFDNSVSLPIQLEKGKRYAIQAIWKEANGDDYLQVAWRKVGEVTPADQLKPIPSKFLSYYGPGAEPAEEPKITRIALVGGQVVLEWSGKVLQSSEDLKTWTDEAGAAKPWQLAPAKHKFYRVKN